MVKISPLCGWRYELGQVGDLSDVTAPPYDVINTQGQTELYEKHPCNVVRLILNREEVGDSSVEDRYVRAAQFLKNWQREGVLVQDQENCFYVYHQEFDWEGTHYIRKGFLGRCGLEEFGEGAVFPHEQTLPGPKKDRLALTQHCRTNLSPIFGLFPDREETAQQILEDAVQGAPPFVATDEQGVIHRFWPVSDHAAISAVQQLLHEKPIFIADGHHRYETALNYREWLKQEGKLNSENHPANNVLMMFVGMSDPGLAILPTHRLVSGLPGLTQPELISLLEKNFRLTPQGVGEEGARETWESMEMSGEQGVLGFGTAADGQWLLAELTDGSPMEELAAEQSPAWRELGVSLLHKLVLGHLLAVKTEGEEASWKYVHLMSEVNEALSGKSCDLAVLVPPAGIDHVREIASNREKMPPKSTFFYPKLLSGLVFNPLS
ncbi:hypothetical protein Pla110_07180 [Polystyrenella longa]|uniref:DUF1015 domain-containing protein n=1 Tax=Polystyrenella longa TaxID=2528007 RepID=A0A518CIK7_9PLAN|nr:DUF1015 domain-containing protein [Polystyrenella longa]QDU79014.1 hypothetical protein Pla110_07180 [Polystyrenella longa]